MQHNKNKQPARTNYEYLNFIRRNQQIVQQFKQISQIDKKQHHLKSVFSKPTNNNKFTIQSQRYVEALPIFQDSLVTYRAKVKNFTNSLDLQSKNATNAQYSMKSRKQSEKQQKMFKVNTYSRNFNGTQPINIQSNSIHEVSSQLKFPKLRNKNRQDLHTNSQTVFSSNPQNKITIDSTDDLKPKQKINLSLDNKQLAYKINNLRLEQVQKTRLNNKVLKTYYEYQSLVSQLKQKVSQLTPTFKPIQPKKREKDKDDPTKKRRDLQKFLQANMIQQIGKKVMLTNVAQIKQDLSKAKNNEGCASSQKNLNNQDQINCIANDISEKKQLILQRQVSVSLSPKKTKQLKKKVQLGQPNLNSQEITVYHNKISSYRQFLFQVNFAHRVFDPLVLQDDSDMHRNIENKYKYYLGPGNNSLLVKSLLKRRFWWVQVSDPKEANFVWTQLKINNYYQFQAKTQLVDKYDKNDQDFQDQIKKSKKKQKIQLNKKPQQNNKVGSILRGQLPEGEKKIFTNADNYYFSQMISNATEQNPKLKHFSKFQTRLKYLPQNFLIKRQPNYKNIHMHNHFVSNFEIGNKKALFYNLKHYYQIKGMNPFDSIPLTFHIKKGTNDPQYVKFLKQYNKLKSELQKAEKGNTSKKKLSRNVWIVKPGQLSNRGNGITVIDQIYELNTILKSKDKHTNGIQKTYIVQKYIQKPLLYKNRKFDIRHYMMISRLHGRMRAYWFSQGYIRTSSYEYNLQQVGDVMIHLTNDAIQKYGASYGKYEEGNKLSYAQFQRYLDSTYPQKKFSFIQSIYPKMRAIATDAVKSTYLWMDPHNLQHNFEVFGLDFMIDANFNVWLIQVNTNPCLELSSGLLGRIIPTMVENSFRLALDPIFPPTAHYLNSIKYLAPDSPMDRLQFQLIFDESRDGKEIQELLKKHGKADCGQIQEEDQTYDNDGKEIDLGGDLQ